MAVYRYTREDFSPAKKGGKSQFNKIWDAVAKLENADDVIVLEDGTECRSLEDVVHAIKPTKSTIDRLQRYMEAQNLQNESDKQYIKKIVIGVVVAVASILIPLLPDIFDGYSPSSSNKSEPVVQQSSSTFSSKGDVETFIYKKWGRLKTDFGYVDVNENGYLYSGGSYVGYLLVDSIEGEEALITLSIDAGAGFLHQRFRVSSKGWYERIR